MDSSKIEIKIARKENFIDLKLCAMEFLDFIKDFNFFFLTRNFLF